MSKRTYKMNKTRNGETRTDEIKSGKIVGEKKKNTEKTPKTEISVKQVKIS